MSTRSLTEEIITAYGRYLLEQERSTGTINKYVRDVREFALWLEDKPISKENASAWKAELQRKGIQPKTINSKIAALNGFLRFVGRESCRVCFLKVQRKMFREKERELTREEYVRLVTAARSMGKDRLALLMESICATGIRVSEVKYLTVEAARRGRAEISMKGKIRTILLPVKLSKKILKYAKKNKIASGEVFLTGSGNSLSRRQIWAEMKKLCTEANVAPSKVFPHNLRHLFAVVFYKVERDIAHLADMLGHASIETTRIYLLASEKEQSRSLEKLHLLC